MMFLQLHLIVGVWLVAFATTEAVGFRPLVSTSYGKVQGVVTSVKGTDRKVHTFRGIPFAKPPVGKLRFSAPQPPEKWANVRDASVFPPMCTQAPAVIGFQNYIFKTVAPAITISEDCLYVNIHAPEPEERLFNKKKPVMLWIYGGALISGAASIYDGSALAAYENVVVVSLQYRLGVLGFFSSGDEAAPGNYGLLDQIEALKWVKQEIANFGGDPDCVTIFGQSAGAVSVSTHMVSPLSKGLFNGAIAESGTALMAGQINTDKQSVIQTRDAIAKATGCVSNTSAEIVACLRTKTAEEVNLPVTSGQIPFLPIVMDGVVLPNSPQQLMTDKAMNNAPMILGYNNDECGYWIPSLFQLAPSPNGITWDEIPNYFLHYQSLLGSDTEGITTILNQYIGSTNDPIEIRNAILRMCKDLVFRLPAQATADFVRNNGQNAYVYEFIHRSSLSSDILPAYVNTDHGQEIAMVFGQPYLIGDVRVNGNFTAAEESLSRRFMKQVANFARTGNPNSFNVQEWPAWDQNQSYQTIDVQTNKKIIPNVGLLQSVLDLANKLLNI